jgi:hypothetical protein
MFLLGAGAAAAGAFLFDKVRRGEVNAKSFGEIGERMQAVSHDVARAASQFRENVVDLSSAAMATMVDINGASREDLEALGLDNSELVDRLIEGRPYRNKLDLLTRMIVPQDVYDAIKEHIEIAHPDESVKVA